MDMKDLYQELIIDHGTCPRNCCEIANATGTAEGFNPLCGDKVRVYLKIENQKIEKASFIGTGCAISIASASLMTEALIGKSIEEALALSHAFHTELVNDCHPTTITSNNLNIPASNPQTESFNQPRPSLGKLVALMGVKAFPARVKCATLSWHTLQAALLHKPQTVTTED